MKQTIRNLFIYSLLFLVLDFTHIASAQSFSIEGKWKAIVTVLGISYTWETQFFPKGSYSELIRSPTNESYQTGTYTFDGNRLSRSVKNWEPKKRWIYLCPSDKSLTNCGHWQEHLKPPGGTFEVSFINANEIKIRDINYGGELIFTRSAE